MKKIFYGLFFFILTFSSINVVRADDRYCTYEIEGTNATIVARIGNNDVYVDYSNAKGKGGEYEYNLTNYNVFDYVKKIINVLNMLIVLRLLFIKEIKN